MENLVHQYPVVRRSKLRPGEQLRATRYAEREGGRRESGVSFGANQPAGL
jgi:hypothetical protein